MRLTLLGRIPSKKNSKVIITTRSRPILVPSSKYNQWHRRLSKELMQYKGSNLSGIHYLLIEFWMPDRRRTDLTNKAESIMDLLVDLNIIKDDSWVVIPFLMLRARGVSKKNPRAEVSIVEN